MTTDGSPTTAFLDKSFGTFREKAGASEAYSGAWDEATLKTAKVEDAVNRKAGVWSATGYLGLPASATHAVYSAYWVALFVLAVWAAAFNTGKGAVTEFGGVPIGEAVGFAVAYSPVLVAMLLALASKDKLSWRWPFHKEPLVGTCGAFLALGWAACILPVYHATAWVAAR